MASGTTPPVEQARTIFTDLGYSVSGDGCEFKAEREWKRIDVTAVTDLAETPTSGTLRCFVTWRENASELRGRLRRAEPEYEWAVIGVSEDGDYEVARSPPSPIAV